MFEWKDSINTSTRYTTAPTQHTLSTSPLNTPSQHTNSTPSQHPPNTPSRHTYSTPHQHPLLQVTYGQKDQQPSPRCNKTSTTNEKRKKKTTRRFSKCLMNYPREKITSRKRRYGRGQPNPTHPSLNLNHTALPLPLTYSTSPLT